MTDYFLANGTNKAPATQAPAHIASWLDTRGYRIVRFPGPGPVDPGDEDLVARITALIDWETCGQEDDRRAIVRQILTSLSAAPAGHTDVGRAA
ncbi:hypothetical protein FHX44_113706 [Pseudonocardia hierapolitana]|uniref:Uncharacterized protein n=2 Tax=Pseudonocardia hierapolitana TaxID=1128676 RepID=A0A561SSG2_9PSEU|nr:hypothetical protein FHX44_113706 [Pseudonocardia hierapolitana]